MLWFHVILSTKFFHLLFYIIFFHGRCSFRRTELIPPSILPINFSTVSAASKAATAGHQHDGHSINLSFTFLWSFLFLVLSLFLARIRFHFTRCSCPRGGGNEGPCVTCHTFNHYHRLTTCLPAIFTPHTQSRHSLRRCCCFFFRHFHWRSLSDGSSSAASLPAPSATNCALRLILSFHRDFSCLEPRSSAGGWTGAGGQRWVGGPSTLGARQTAPCLCPSSLRPPRPTALTSHPRHLTSVSLRAYILKLILERFDNRTLQ